MEPHIENSLCVSIHARVHVCVCIKQFVEQGCIWDFCKAIFGFGSELYMQGSRVAASSCWH